MLMGYFVFVSIILILQVTHGVSGGSDEFVRSWHIADSCGYMFNAYAGQMIFHSNAITVASLYRHRCTITIKATEFETQGYTGQRPRILLYFTDMELNYNCKHANLTFHDGPDTTYPVLKGTKEGMCGNNETLEHGGLFFHTVDSSGILTVDYRWSEDYKPYEEFHSFTFFYNVYSIFTADSQCKSSNGLHLCSTYDRCVPGWLYCPDDDRIVACGDPDDVCRPIPTTTVPTITEPNYDNWIKTIAWISGVMAVLIIAGKYCASKTCDKDDDEEYDAEPNADVDDRQQEADNTPSERASLTSSSSSDDSYWGPSRPADNSEWGPLEHTTLELEPMTPSAPLRPESETPTPSAPSAPTSNGYGYATGTDNSPSDQGNGNPIPTNNPPPSYDDAMSPSYDEVMANQDKYRTTPY